MKTKAPKWKFPVVYTGTNSGVHYGVMNVVSDILAFVVEGKEAILKFVVEIEGGEVKGHEALDFIQSLALNDGEEDAIIVKHSKGMIHEHFKEENSEGYEFKTVIEVLVLEHSNRKVGTTRRVIGTRRLRKNMRI